MLFGVSIDSFFDMTDENRMDRIETGLENIRFLSQEEFSQQEKYLTDCRKKPELHDRATLLLAMLYNKRATEYHELAKPLAREAVAADPGKKDAHNAVFEAERGPYSDWNCTNHCDLINFYKDIIDANPQIRSTYFWLLDLLIKDGRTEEARAYVEKMRQLKDTFHYEMYMGYICQMEGDLESAMDWWKKMVEKEPENWLVWAQYGDVLAKLARYDEAEKMYRKAQPLRPKPRFVDCEEAISMICQIRGDIDGAIAMTDQMLAITREEWTTEGELVDALLRKRQSLEEMKR